MNLSKEIEHENTIHRLKGDPIDKICKMCVHYKKDSHNARCTRDLHMGFHPVTGKKGQLGETHFCSHEREVETAHPTLVESGDKCGAIGQFFKVAPPKRNWFRRLLNIPAEEK